tara:strand:- start:625 stop:1239 length:615 start_codon:yes stop_codon:yes gene_type:complete
MSLTHTHAKQVADLKDQLEKLQIRNDELHKLIKEANLHRVDNSVQKTIIDNWIELAMEAYPDGCHDERHIALSFHPPGSTALSKGGGMMTSSSSLKDEPEGWTSEVFKKRFGCTELERPDLSYIINLWLKMTEIVDEEEFSWIIKSFHVSWSPSSVRFNLKFERQEKEEVCCISDETHPRSEMYYSEGYDSWISQDVYNDFEAN